MLLLAPFWPTAMPTTKRLFGDIATTVLLHYYYADHFNYLGMCDGVLFYNKVFEDDPRIPTGSFS